MRRWFAVEQDEPRFCPLIGQHKARKPSARNLDPVCEATPRCGTELGQINETLYVDQVAVDGPRTQKSEPDAPKAVPL